MFLARACQLPLLMANFQANLRALINVTDDLEELIKLSNQKVIDSVHYEKFITLFIAIYDRKKQELSLFKCRTSTSDT